MSSVRSALPRAPIRPVQLEGRVREGGGRGARLPGAAPGRAQRQGRRASDGPRDVSGGPGVRIRHSPHSTPHVPAACPPAGCTPRSSPPPAPTLASPPSTTRMRAPSPRRRWRPSSTRKVPSPAPTSAPPSHRQMFPGTTRSPDSGPATGSTSSHRGWDPTPVSGRPRPYAGHPCSEVQYHGQPLGVVVAPTRNAARRLAAAVNVEYQDAPEVKVGQVFLWRSRGFTSFLQNLADAADMDSYFPVQGSHGKGEGSSRPRSLHPHPFRVHAHTGAGEPRRPAGGRAEHDHRQSGPRPGAAPLLHGKRAAPSPAPA